MDPHTVVCSNCSVERLEGNFFCFGWDDGEVEYFVGIIESASVRNPNVVSGSFLVCDADVVVLSHEYAGDCDWCSGYYC